MLQQHFWWQVYVAGIEEILRHYALLNIVDNKCKLSSCEGDASFRHSVHIECEDNYLVSPA